MQTTKTKSHIEAKDGQNLSPSQVFEQTAYAERLKQLYNTIVSLMAHEEMRQIAMEHKKRFETPPSYEYSFSQLEERFGKEAMGEAMEIIEIERRNVVEEMSDYMRDTLNSIIRQLRFLVYGENGKGKIYLKKVPVEGSVHPNQPSERDILYFETYPEGVQRYNEIERQKGRLLEFEQYFAYMNQELVALYQQASTLAELEFVVEEKGKGST
jgi:hypothetical protein